MKKKLENYANNIIKAARKDELFKSMPYAILDNGLYAATEGYRMLFMTEKLPTEEAEEATASCYSRVLNELKEKNLIRHELPALDDIKAGIREVAGKHNSHIVVLKVARNYPAVNARWLKDAMYALDATVCFFDEAEGRRAWMWLFQDDDPANPCCCMVLPVNQDFPDGYIDITVALQREHGELIPWEELAYKPAPEPDPGPESDPEPDPEPEPDPDPEFNQEQEPEPVQEPEPAYDLAEARDTKANDEEALLPETRTYQPIQLAEPAGTDQRTTKEAREAAEEMRQYAMAGALKTGAKYLFFAASVAFFLLAKVVKFGVKIGWKVVKATPRTIFRICKAVPKVIVKPIEWLMEVDPKIYKDMEAYELSLGAEEKVMRGIRQTAEVAIGTAADYYASINTLPKIQEQIRKN